MTAHQDTQAQVLIADYIGIDAASKVNALGAGLQIAPILQTGQTSPLHVVAIIDFPAAMYGQTVPVTIELRDMTTDSVVMMPGPAGPSQALRVQQLVQVARPTVNVPGLFLPDDLPSRAQIALAFPNGLPLVPGRSYLWKLEVDGTRRKGWAARFFVPAPPQPPILGGPAGPANIPNVISPIVDEPEDDEPLSDG